MVVSSGIVENKAVAQHSVHEVSFFHGTVSETSQKRLWQLHTLLIKEECQLLFSLIGRNAWQKNVRKVGFVLAHRLRELSPAVMWPQALGQGIMVPGTWQSNFFTSFWLEAEQGTGKENGKIQPYHNAPNDLLPPSWPYLLKFPWPPRTTPPFGTKHLNMNLCRTLNTPTVITGHECPTQLAPSVFRATLQASHNDDSAS